MRHSSACYQQEVSHNCLLTPPPRLAQQFLRIGMRYQCSRTDIIRKECDAPSVLNQGSVVMCHERGMGNFILPGCFVIVLLPVLSGDTRGTLSHVVVDSRRNRLISMLPVYRFHHGVAHSVVSLDFQFLRNG